MLDGNALLRQKRDEVPEGTLSCPARNLAVFHHYRHYEGLRLLPSVYDSKLIQQTLVSFMETAFCSDGAMLDSNELYNVTSLLNEMEFTEDQSVRMINAYFGKGTEKVANTKTCEISF